MSAELVGREELRDALLQEVRAGAGLWTLSGPAGVGKSRLARAVVEAWDGASHVIDLADVPDLSRVLEALGLTLRVRPSEDLGDADYAARLTYALAARGRALILLDDADRLLDPVSGLIEDWRQSAPELRVVVTSREPLALRGERLREVPPLSPPHALALFEARARAARPGLALSEDERSVLREVVARVDHLPLAIELAAARMRVLDARALLLRLSSRLELLVAGFRTDKPRQRSLRGAIDVSWELLEDAERRALASLAELRGEFTLEEASALLGHDALEAVTGLVQRSLLYRRGVDARFGMLASIREYARGRAEGDLAPARARLAAWFATRARGLERDDLARSRATLDELVVDALAADPTVAAADALEIALALARLPRPAREEADRIGALVAHATEAAPALVSRARVERAALLLRAGRPDEVLTETAAARAGGAERETEIKSWLVEGRMQYLAGRLEEAERAYAEAERLDGGGPLRAWLLWELGAVHHARGDRDRMTRAYRAAIREARLVGDRRAEAEALSRKGFVACDRGDFAEAQESLAQAIGIHRELGERRGEAIAVGYLGNLERARGHRVKAEDAYAESLAILRSLGDRQWASVVSMDLGILHLAHGDAERAELALREAARDASASGGRRIQGLVTGYRAMVSADVGAHPEAVAGLDRAEALLGPRDAFRRVTKLQRAYVELAAGRSASVDEEEPTTAHERIVRELIARRRFADAVRVRPDGASFILPGGPEVESGGGAAAAILCALVDARRHRAGDPCALEELFERGWPGQRIARASRQNRVRVAIAKLRRLGLRDLIETVPGGYRLDPSSRVVLDASASTSSATDP